VKESNDAAWPSSATDRERAIGAFTATTLGREPTRVARIKAFETNEVYEVDVGTERFIVKATMHDPLRAEAWACRQGANAGCAAPPILGLDRLDERTSAFIMRRIDGAPIGADRDAFVDLGQRLRHLHRVTRPRFGTLAEASWNVRGEFTLGFGSWLQFVDRICSDALRMAHRDANAKSVAEAATAAVGAHVDAFAAIRVGSLCHGDLKRAHILVDSGRLTAVIDWGDAVFGDPLWEIARYAHRADDESLAWLLGGYDPDRARAADLRWCLPLYSALWMLVDAIVDHRLGHRFDVPLEAAMRYLRLHDAS
jgi:aminoglycoside phosphotransferase (APT) family kinase protein